jgi:pimeloyl-ACP methyl ester carboxylesterase
LILGLLQYITKIRQLKQLHGDRPLILLQLDYISLSLIHKIPTTEEHVTLIDHIFTSHSLKPANWVSHSYGSFVGAFITEKRPHLVNNITFVDPICFGLIFCNSLYNLLFTPVKCWTLGFIRYFGAFELSFNYIIHREFVW